MDLLDRLLAHDTWTTRRLLDLADGLTEEQLDRDFDLGHRSVRATLLHVVRNVEVWADLMAGAAVRENPESTPAGRSVAGLRARHERAAADLAALARSVAERQGWDERWIDGLDDPPAEKTYGGAIAHVITHSMHHRAQLIHMLRRLGVAAVPEGDVLGWERQLAPEPRAAALEPGIVSLREIDESNLRAVCRLAVRADQQRFVATNAMSIAQAHFSAHAWFRGIYADETPVGFAMLDDRPDKPEYFLWRFMIDARHQGTGYGRQALRLLVAHVRTRPGATTFMTSVVPGPGSPQPFYEAAGFVLTGGIEDGELILALDLGRPA